jgi:hypothetical protein
MAQAKEKKFEFRPEKNGTHDHCVLEFGVLEKFSQSLLIE